MNSIFFFIPFFLIAGTGIIQDSFAQTTVTGYDYFDVTNPDGSHSWSTHYPYILNESNQYVPFLQTGTKIETEHGSVILNTDGSYSFYKKGIVNSPPLFTDSIKAKYADISNLNSWTYPANLNNDTPDTTWNGSGLVSTKNYGGVGKLEYKYILDNGQWKTQLEATNFSALNTKAFGFDQTIDLNRDTISFGGQQRNLDNFNGTSFDKTWLENNKGKMIEFLNDVTFDFDLGFDNLYSVTIYDTGINSSRLVFDYRTATALLPGNTLVIDPTFGYTTGSIRDFFSNDCITVDGLAGNGEVGDSGGICRRTGVYYNIASIPNSATITNVQVRYDVTATFAGGVAADWMSMEGQLSTQTNQQAFTDMGDGTVFVNADTNFQTVANDYVKDLGASADADLEAELAVDNEWSFGLKQDVYPTGTNSYEQTAQYELQVTYTATSPDRIDTLTHANLGVNTLDLIWTAPSMGSGSFVNYLINYTTPYGNPHTFLANTTNTYYNVTGRAFSTPYSFRVSALTDVGYNATGNILNVTTLGNLYSSLVPTSLVVINHNKSPSILDLEWLAPLMDNINGYRIWREAPVGNGFARIVSNTTNTNQYYNNTGLSVNTYYNYKVAAMNQTGITGNSTTYSLTTYHLPDAVDDLLASATDIISIDLSWTQPNTLYGYLTGYNINYTTPKGNPLTVYVASTGNSAVEYEVTGLDASEEYSFRVSAITIHGKNVTGANISNATAFNLFEIGNIQLPTGDNPDTAPIIFEVVPVDADTDDVQVFYDSSYNLACDFGYTIGNTNTTYSGLTENPISGTDVYTNFTVNGIDNDIIDIYCWDQLDNSTDGSERIGQGAVPLFDQVTDFQLGLFGTDGKFGALDFMTLIIVIISMIGFNRYNPAVGVGLMVAMIGVTGYYGLIEPPTIIIGVIILVFTLAIALARSRGTD